MPGEYSPPINAFYNQIPVPDNINVAVFIGSDGCYFKKTTERSGCDYIWYDGARNVVEVWGKKEHTIGTAIDILNKRISILQSRVPTQI